MEIRVGFFRAKGVGEYYDLKRQYKDMRYWLIGEGYSDSGTVDFPERYFYQMDTQKDGKTFYVWWRPRKGLGVFSGGLTGDKGVHFFKSLKINMFGHKMKPAEIMHAGKKIKVHKGTFEYMVHSMIDFSMPSWENGSEFKQGLFDVFWRRVFHKQIEAYKKECLKDTYKLQAHMKKMLNMETWNPAGKTFEPHYGISDTEFK
jgi:hypothetical protein